MRRAQMIGLSSAAIVTTTVLVTSFAFTDVAQADTYDLVPPTQDAVCHELVKHLNAIDCHQVASCSDFDPNNSCFPTPKWIRLGDEEARQAARALKSVEHAKITAAGPLKAWGAHLDLVGSGQQVRVVLLDFGGIDIGQRCYQNTMLAVLVEDGFEVDGNYANLSVRPGELLLYNGIAYIAHWSTVPDIVLGRTSSRKRFKSYLWITPVAREADHVISVGGGTMCQLGWNPSRARHTQGKK